jgi:nitroreductase
VDDSTIEQILEAAIWAPSPANNQPWEFIVIRDGQIRERIHQECDACKKILFEKSGWKWVNKYRLNFLQEAPVIIAVIGDPRKTGADMFLEGGGNAYQHACGAAIQNMLLAAHALGLGTLWFTLFDQETMKSVLTINPDKELIALVCLGTPGAKPMETPRTPVREKIDYI